MRSESQTLGKLVKHLRQKRAWTLRQMSDEIGIPVSTLAKIEADKLSLTYDKLQHVSSRLGLTMAEFLGNTKENTLKATSGTFTARRSVTTASNSIQISTPTYDYEYLCTDLREKHMVPMRVRIRAHDIVEFKEPIRHEGEEFIYVLEGKLEVHLQFYAPVTLSAGTGIYIDSSMGHIGVAKDCESALVLAVCSSESRNLGNALMSLVENGAREMV